MLCCYTFFVVMIFQLTLIEQHCNICDYGIGLWFIILNIKQQCVTVSLISPNLYTGIQQSM